MDFIEQVLSIVRHIPPGRITTYGEIAAALGNRKLSRAVGHALRRNPHPVRIPCHRVVYSDGRLGGYSLGINKKEKLLREEGIQIKNGKIVDFEKLILAPLKIKNQEN